MVILTIVLVFNLEISGMRAVLDGALSQVTLNFSLTTGLVISDQVQVVNGPEIPSLILGDEAFPLILGDEAFPLTKPNGDAVLSE